MGKSHSEESPDERLSSFWNRLLGRMQSNVGQIALSACFFAVASLLGIYLWGRFSERILAGKNYTVSRDRIHVPNVPPWVRTDFKGEAILSGSLEDMHIQQKDLQRRVASAFEMHPWVAEVRRVTTRFPGQVVVDLSYRRPIAMVAVDVVSPVTGRVEKGVYPVDATGTLLPTDGFSEEQAANFPRIIARDSTPLGGPGSAWGDTRVHGAAKIAQHLEKSWNRLGLSTIIAHPDHTGIAAPTTVYEIQTHDNTTIVWGHGPGEEHSDEPKAARKVQRLLTYLTQKGALSVDPGQIIDLRHPDRLTVGTRENLDITLQ